MDEHCSVPYNAEAGFFPWKQCFPGIRQTLINENTKWINGDMSPQILAWVDKGDQGINLLITKPMFFSIVEVIQTDAIAF